MTFTTYKIPAGGCVVETAAVAGEILLFFPSLSLRYIRIRSNEALAMHTHNKKEMILQNTLKLIKRYGLSHTSMDRIAELTSVSKKTLYVFFSGKEQLLMQALELEAKEIREAITLIQVKKQSMPEYWCQVLHIFAQRMYTYAPVLVREFTHCMPLINWANTQKTQMAALISEATDSISQKQKIEILLRSFLGILSRSLTQSPYKIPLKALKDTVIPFYCRGL